MGLGDHAKDEENRRQEGIVGGTTVQRLRKYRPNNLSGYEE